jgi:glycosyltransferase involved in cell wall biosynthesis
MGGEPARSVIMFAYHFPPCVCAPTASLRAEGLARGLSERGWAPVVVTRENGCRCLDERGGSGSPSARPSFIEVRRIRVHSSLLMRLSAFSGRHRESPLSRQGAEVLYKVSRVAMRLTEKRNDWTQRALDEGRRIFSERLIDAIWTTCGPYRTIRVGRRLQRRYGKPWLVDLRDSIGVEGWWKQSFGKAWMRRMSTLAFTCQRWYWFRLLRTASIVTGVSPQESGIDAAALGREVHSIPSGFDEAAWRSLRSTVDVQGEQRPRFIVLYAGLFRGGLRTAGGVFFEGLRRFIDGDSPPPAVEILYLGHEGEGFLAQAAMSRCEGFAVDGGLVSPEEARRAMHRAHLLLHLSPVQGRSGIPGGKLYEYLAAGPPILSVPGQDEFVMQILAETDAGEGASDSDAVAAALRRRYEEWKLGRATMRPLDGLSRFSWSARAQRLAELLGSVA